MKEETYTALSHFNFETRHGAHERSTLDLFWGASAVVAAAAAGLAWPAILLSIVSIVQRVENKTRSRENDEALKKKEKKASLKSLPFTLPPKVSASSRSQG